MKYSLIKPIAFGDGPPVTELTFREEICAGDMRGIVMREAMEFGDMLKIAGRLCGQPDALMNKLSFADMLKVLEMVGLFMGAGPETGQTP